MKITLGKKLIGSFIGVSLMLLIVAYFGVSSTKGILTEYGHIMEVNVPLETQVADTGFIQMEKIAALRALLLYKDNSYIEQYHKHDGEQKSIFAELKKLSMDDKSQEYLQKLEGLTANYNSVAEQIFKHVKAGDIAAGMQATNEGRQIATDFNTTIDEWNKHIHEINEQIILDVQASSNQSVITVYIVSGVALVVSMLLGLFISRGITKPVNEMLVLLTDMAQSGGDLTKRIVVASKDEIGDLADAFNAFMDKLHDVIAQVRQSANMVTTAAAETSLGNQDLSQRTEEQASSLEEISSTIEEVAASLQRSVESANDADRNSQATMQTVNKGEVVVNELHGAMAEITKGSHEIAEIIAKVNDIAFQTNLLALNAAVEAARAGEQGRGFAVVAAEVRNLAGRTAESAKEIEGLIKESITKVERGNQLMEQTAAVLGDIVNNTQQTTGVIAEISASMREQAISADDIRTAVEQLNQVTQQNASLVEEIAGSSESVSNEAEELSTMVGKFRLKEGAAGSLEKTKYQYSGARNSGTTNKSNQVSSHVNKPQVQFDEGDFERF